MQVSLDGLTKRRGPRLAQHASRWTRSLIVVALTVAAMFGPATAALAASGQARGSVFGGLTSQGWPAVFQVSGNGRALRFASAGLWMKCTSGEQFALTGDFARVPIAANGQFRSKLSQAPTTQADGTTVGFAETIRGTLDHRRRWVSGVWRLQMTVAPASGQSDSCDSGAVRVHALQ